MSNQQQITFAQMFEAHSRNEYAPRAIITADNIQWCYRVDPREISEQEAFRLISQGLAGMFEGQLYFTPDDEMNQDMYKDVLKYGRFENVPELHDVDYLIGLFIEDQDVDFLKDLPMRRKLYLARNLSDDQAINFLEIPDISDV